jgi:hypothetical protein
MSPALLLGAIEREAVAYFRRRGCSIRQHARGRLNRCQGTRPRGTFAAESVLLMVQRDR